MTIIDPHTIPEKLLLAAAEVSSKRSPWPIEQLVVHAWKTWPDTFGLRWYKETYPNANIVISAVVGKRGLAGRGYLEKIHPNIYELTRIGLECVRIIREGQGSLKKRNVCKSTPGALNGKRVNMLVSNLQNTVAYREDCAGARIGITFVEAEAFFRGENRADVLRELRTIGESEKSEAGQARALYGLADYLSERFARAWEVHDKVEMKR